MRQGLRSPKWGHMGVHFLCTGPQGPLPGERVQVVIYDRNDVVVRRFEQRRGECLDAGWVDGFNLSLCRPAVYRLPVVDIAPSGFETTLLSDFQAGTPMGVFNKMFETWVREYGVPQ